MSIMKEITPEILFAKYMTDWVFLSEKLKLGSETEISIWANRWTQNKNFDLNFLFHNGVLKTFSWFIVDNGHPEIRHGDTAKAKTAIFDLFDGLLALNEDKTLCRNKNESIDWLRLRKDIDASLTLFRSI